MDRKSYLETLTEQIRTKRARGFISEEIEQHIDDQKQAFIAEGMTAAEAEEAAVKEMGDPVEVGVSMDRIHRPKMEWRVLMIGLILSLLGMVIQTNILRHYYKDMIIIQGMIGIMVMLVVCYIDYSQLSRISLPAWVILHIGILFGSLGMGTIVNGRSKLAIGCTYFLIPFYIGVIYHFRLEGKKGFFKSVILLLISIIFCIQIPFAGSAFVVAVTGFVILNLAIKRGWFGREQMKMQRILWGVFLSGVLLILGIFTWISRLDLENYQKARFDALASGEYAVQLRQEAVEFAQTLKQNAPNVYEDYVVEHQIVGHNVQNDYVWNFVFHYFGTWQGVLMLGGITVSMGIIFWIVRRQKNKLGYMVGMGCMVYLVLQSVCYVASDAGVHYFAGGNFMPFISNGMTTKIAAGFYMGLILSTCRNEKVVRN